MISVYTVIKYILSVKSSITVDPQTQRFIDFNLNKWKSRKLSENPSEVLVELYPVSQTVLAFSYFANALAEKHGARLLSFSTSSRNSFLYKLRHRSLYEIYKSFCVESHVNTGLQKYETKAKEASAEILSKIKTKEDILDLVVDGYPIGSDIYEAYLISKVRPTLEPGSVEFSKFLAECLGTFYFWRNYFERRAVKAIIMSHGIYQYGIIARIAIKMGIPVYLPNIRGMGCLKNPGELGNPHFHLYPELFKSLSLDTQEKGVEWAKQQLQRRLSGVVGVDMSYSTKSAYDRTSHSGKVLREGKRLKVLIATHCFFDNPNAYGRNLFPDFYEWLIFLGEMSNKTNYDWYLKTHPDVVPGNEPIISEILSKYPKITRVPSSVSQHQLAEEGIKVVLTVYGSVGHECPLLGETVINAGMNPHIAYKFNVHPKTIAEYTDILLNLDTIKMDFDTKELYEFYFIQHKINVAQKLFFNSYSDFISKLNVEEQNTSKVYEYFMAEYSKEKDASIRQKIRIFIDSGNYKYYENMSDIDFPIPADRC